MFGQQCQLLFGSPLVHCWNDQCYSYFHRAFSFKLGLATWRDELRTSSRNSVTYCWIESLCDRVRCSNFRNICARPRADSVLLTICWIAKRRVLGRAGSNHQTACAGWSDDVSKDAAAASRRRMICCSTRSCVAPKNSRAPAVLAITNGNAAEIAIGI